jgi:hypothetical protein
MKPGSLVLSFNALDILNVRGYTMAQLMVVVLKRSVATI